MAESTSNDAEPLSFSGLSFLEAGEGEGVQESLSDILAPLMEDGTSQTQENQITQGAAVTIQRHSVAPLLTLDRASDHNHRINSLVAATRQMTVIANLKALGDKFGMSAPLVAAFDVIPEFRQAVKNFPGSDQFNIVPEHKSAASSVMAMESLTDAETTSGPSLTAKAQDLVAVFESLLNGLGATASALQDQISDYSDALDASDVDDEASANIAVHTLSADGFSDMFGKLEQYLPSIQTFSADELRAYPDRLKSEIDTLNDLVGDLGRVLGIGMDDSVLVESDQDPAFNPTPGTFGDKDITASDVIVFMSRAKNLCDVLNQIADRRDELVGALKTELGDCPTEMVTTDTQYGCVDHVRLIGCYTQMATSLIREAILLISNVLAAADALVDNGVNEVPDSSL